MMKGVIRTEKHPIKLWLDDVEEGALAQARNLANLPFLFSHVALMPDAHQGYGMPIGGVIATRDVIIPNAVGVDIGCGMGAVRTSLRHLERHTLQKIMGGGKHGAGIRDVIPLGARHHDQPQQEHWLPPLTADLPLVTTLYADALTQVGTLGSGNHFIEIQQGSDGHIWLMVHSGSRNLGYRIAHHYNALAVRLNKKWRSPVPAAWELAHLPLSSDEGQTYLREMAYCAAFAFANRCLMMARIKEVVADLVADVTFGELINVPHNYAARETHFNQEVLVHRKGATRAFAGELGIIPGSQGSQSYIVRGKGEQQSFMSCSHGAGRTMSRTQARKALNLAAEKKHLDALGVIHGLRSTKDLDEATGAYKDISTVMANQADLVDIEIELRPLAVIKG